MASRRARIAAFALLGSLSALAVATGAVWWQRCALAEWIALRELRARGVPAALHVARLDTHGAEITGLTLGVPASPDLALAHATLAWSWPGLRAGRLDRVALRGVRLRARIDDDGVHLGAIGALLEGEARAAGEPLALPFLEAQLADAEAVIDSPRGALLLRAEGSAQPEGELVRATVTLHGESPQGALDFGGGGTVNLASQEIAAAGALAGVTPWGRADGFARVQGTLAALRAEISGSVQPDGSALPVSAAEPIHASGVATRDEHGTIDATLKLAARGVAIEGVAEIASLESDAVLRSDASGLGGDATFTATGARLADVGSAVRVEGAAKLRAGRIDASAALREVELPDLARAPSADVRGSYDLASEAATLHVEAPHALAPELARIAGLVGDFTLARGVLAGEVRVAQLVELSQPALIAPLRVEAALSGTLDRIALTGKAFSPGDGLAFDLSGTLAPSLGQLELKIVLPETDLSPKTRQPGRVFPWLADVIRATRGKVGGEALASIVGERFGASGVIALNGADVVTEWGTLRGLMGVVVATAIDPLETPPGQTVWMQSVDAGLPLGNGTLRFQLRPEGVLQVEHAEWGFAGGKLSFAGAIPLEASERAIDLQVEGVSVEKLLAALDFEGLKGTGALGGVAPILQRGDALLVRGAELRATETGVIRFTSGEGGAALASKQPALAPLLGALEDLRYDELGLTLNGDLSDRVDVKLHIRGRNPNFQKGRPVVLNVNVDLPLGSLLRAASVATGVPDEIEEQVQRAMGKEKP